MDYELVETALERLAELHQLLIQSNEAVPVPNSAAAEAEAEESADGLRVRLRIVRPSQWSTGFYCSACMRWLQDAPLLCPHCADILGAATSTSQRKSHYFVCIFGQSIWQRLCPLDGGLPPQLNGAEQRRKERRA